MSIKVSQLTLADTPLSGGESVLMNQNGLTVTSKLSEIKTYVNSNISLSGSSLIMFSDGANFAMVEAVRKIPDNSNFLGNGTGHRAGLANDSNFLGFMAGSGATNANDSNFLGSNAGAIAANANKSNFLGSNAGFQAHGAYRSNFLGHKAGDGATTAHQSNFIGSRTGVNTTGANDSNFIGFQAGYNALNANDSNFFGNNAGYGATGADNSNFLGYHAGVCVTGTRNQLFGKDTSVLPLSTSDCLVIGTEAVATQNNTIALGSTTYPFLTAAGGTAPGAITTYLVVRVNGIDLKIPCYA